MLWGVVWCMERKGGWDQVSKREGAVHCCPISLHNGPN